MDPHALEIGIALHPAYLEQQGYQREGGAKPVGWPEDHWDDCWICNDRIVGDRPVRRFVGL